MKYRLRQTTEVEAAQFFVSRPKPFANENVCRLGLGCWWLWVSPTKRIQLQEGDWVVKGTSGVFFKYSPAEFRELYEVAQDTLDEFFVATHSHTFAPHSRYFDIGRQVDSDGMVVVKQVLEAGLWRYTRVHPSNLLCINKERR